MMDRHDDVRFRGKPINDLTREEAIEALKQALSEIKRRDAASVQRASNHDMDNLPGVWGQAALQALRTL
jgi:hypothetical protein